MRVGKFKWRLHGASVTFTTRLYVGMVLFCLAGHAYTNFSNLDATWIAQVASAATLLTGCWAAFGEFAADDRGRRSLVGVLLLGTSSEIVGLWTGYPFGRYSYSTRWWPTIELGSLGPFPMLLPFAWLLVAGCSYIVARGAADLLSERNRKWIAPLLGATLSALVDLWMEPVMTRTLEYWRWKPNGPLPGGAPWSNLAGWFGVSLVAGMLLNRLRNPIPVENAAIVLIGQVVLLFGLRFI